METNYLKEHRTLILIFLISIILSLYLSIYLFIYDSNTYCVSSHKVGELGWCSYGSGTFFPFPRNSGPLPATSRSYSMIDYLIYILLLETYIIYLLPIVSWIFTVILLYFIILDYKKRVKSKIE